MLQTFSQALYAKGPPSSLNDVAFAWEQAMDSIGLSYSTHALFGPKPGDAITFERRAPEDWTMNYLHQGLTYRDPSISALSVFVAPHSWKQAGEALGDPVHCLEQAAEAGMKNGWSVPVFVRGLSGAVSVSGRDEPLDETEAMEVAAAAQILHVTRVQLGWRGKQPELTEREKELLSLAAMGKTGKEMAHITKLSFASVNLAFRGIYDKFGVYDRTHAVTVALCRGLIEVPRDGFLLPERTTDYEL